MLELLIVFNCYIVAPAFFLKKLAASFFFLLRVQGYGIHGIFSDPESNGRTCWRPVEDPQ